MEKSKLVSLYDIWMIKNRTFLNEWFTIYTNRTNKEKRFFMVTSETKKERTVEKTPQEQQKVQIVKVTITNLVLRDLLKEKFVTELDKLCNELKIEITPISLILISESKDEKEKKIEPIILGHDTKKNIMDNKINLESGNQQILDKVIEILKKVE